MKAAPSVPVMDSGPAPAGRRVPEQ